MGPLTGIRVIEMKGIGPGPYAGMLLADMGAEVIVVERSSTHSSIGPPSARDVNSRGKKSIALNLKSPDGLKTLLRLIATADMLLEGNRPGVAERLGFGPDVCLERKPQLIYGRVTGWGQTGPLAHVAGHDINYISITGALAAIGGPDKPVPPLNLVGDYAGGSLFLIIGMLAAYIESKASGKGQVIDAAITDGSASLMSMFHGLAGLGQWQPERRANFLDGGAHFYNVYETSDGKFVSIGSIEPQFFALLIEKAGLDVDDFGAPSNAVDWPLLEQKLADVFKARTQAQWCAVMEGTDVCFAPVLDFLAAPNHPHNQARNTYIEIDGLVQPAPAPRFSRTTCEVPAKPSSEGADTEAVLIASGFNKAEIDTLIAAGAVS